MSHFAVHLKLTQHCKLTITIAHMLNHVQLFVTPWTVAQQVLLSMGFSGQEYCSGLSCPPPGDLPDPGIESVTLTSPALAGRFFTTKATTYK